MGIFDKLENLKPVNTWRPYIPHCGIFLISLIIMCNVCWISLIIVYDVCWISLIIMCTVGWINTNNCDNDNERVKSEYS